MFEDNPYMAKLKQEMGDINLQVKIDHMLGKSQPGQEEDFEE